MPTIWTDHTEWERGLEQVYGTMKAYNPKTTRRIAVREAQRRLYFRKWPFDGQNQPAEMPVSQRAKGPLSKFAAAIIYNKHVADGEECGITWAPLASCSQVFVNTCGHVFDTQPVLKDGYKISKCPMCQAAWNPTILDTTAAQLS